MLIKKHDVKKIFVDVINGRMSREDADCWAWDKIKLFDRNQLKFESREDADLLWRAITYLYGLDLQVEPGRYFHSLSDIESTYIDQWCQFLEDSPKK